MMPQMFCTRYFLESQGYGIDKNILYQYNMNVMLLEENTKKCSTKNTKHINVRYYFIKDWLKTGDVVIKHCAMEEMLGAHFTKPLQGALFRKFMAEIMNIPNDLDMVEMGMDRTGLKKRITCKLHNEIDPRCPQEGVGDCGKVGKENGAMKCPDGGTHNGTYDAVVFKKEERGHGRLEVTLMSLGNM